MATNFPNGLNVGGGSPVTGSGGLFTTGNVYYVGNAGSNEADDASHGTATAPFATLDYAIGRCTANQGDVIYVMPGHAENVGAAAAIACDVAGISIIGLGNGSNRPTFSWSATASTWTISAANVFISNIRCTASIDEVVKLFSVTAAGVTLDRVDYFETASCQAIQFLLTTNAADQLTIRNCFHRQANAAGSAQLWIQLVGCDHTRIEDNIFLLTLQNGATCAVINGSTAVVECIIARNIIEQKGGTTQVSAILLAANSTGYVADNRVAAAVTTLAGTVALANCYGANNLVSHTVNKSGILDPVADT